MPTKAAIRNWLTRAKGPKAPTRLDAGARRLLDLAARFRELGVDPYLLAVNAYGAEARVQEWLSARGLPKSDVPYHLHEMLASDPGLFRAPSVAAALADLADLQAEGHVPDALEEVTRALLSRRPRRRGVRSGSFSERKRDEDDLEALAVARRDLRAMTRLPREGQTAEGIRAALRWGEHPVSVKHSKDLARHLRAKRLRRRRAETQALLLWAEWTGRRSRDPLKLSREKRAIEARRTRRLVTK